MKIIVTGSRGMLDRDLLVRLAQAGYVVVGFDLPALDITKSKGVLTCFGGKRPNILINCAAYSAADR
ncbi:MAG: sugar nucleotide-binding protein [Candidatus Hodarchaeota archaeon]